MSKASVLLSTRFKVMSFPVALAVKVMVVPDKVIASPPSPMLAIPLRVVVPVTVSVESKVRAEVIFPPVMVKSPKSVMFPASVKERISVPPSVCSIKRE